MGSFEGNLGCSLANGQGFGTLQPLMMNPDDDPLKAYLPEAAQHILNMPAKAFRRYIHGTLVWSCDRIAGWSIPERRCDDTVDTFCHPGEEFFDNNSIKPQRHVRPMVLNAARRHQQGPTFIDCFFELVRQ